MNTMTDEEIEFYEVGVDAYCSRCGDGLYDNTKYFGDYICASCTEGDEVDECVICGVSLYGHSAYLGDNICADCIFIQETEK